MKGIVDHGIKEKPVWYDIYEAFPPLVEPNAQRPPPQDKKIKKILYKEDAIRA